MTLSAPTSTSPDTTVVPVPDRRGTVTCFSVTGTADPGLLPRVMEIWAKRGLVPQRLHSTRGERGACELSVDVQDVGLDPRRVRQFAEEMRRIVGVSLVLVSETDAALCA